MIAGHSHGKTHRQILGVVECLRAGNTATVVVGSHARKVDLVSRLRAEGASDQELRNLAVVIQRGTRLRVVKSS